MLYQHLDFNSPEQKDRFKFYERLGVIVLFLALLFFTSTAIIGAGERGIVLRLGSVNRVLEDGFHFKLPILEKVNTLNIRHKYHSTSFLIFRLSFLLDVSFLWG